MLDLLFSFMIRRRKDSLGNLKIYSKSEVISFQKGVKLSTRSYKSYFTLIGMFLLIMIPVSFLTFKMLRKRTFRKINLR